MALRFDVIAPCDGTVERVGLRKGEQIEEGNVIFSLRAKEEVLHDIFAPVSGITDVVEVEQGDFTISGMILAYIIQR